MADRFIDQVLQNRQKPLEIYIKKKLSFKITTLLLLCELLVCICEWPGVQTIETDALFTNVANILKFSYFFLLGLS